MTKDETWTIQDYYAENAKIEPYPAELNGVVESDWVNAPVYSMMKLIGSLGTLFLQDGFNSPVHPKTPISTGEMTSLLRVYAGALYSGIKQDGEQRVEMGSTEHLEFPRNLCEDDLVKVIKALGLPSNWADLNSGYHFYDQGKNDTRRDLHSGNVADVPKIPGLKILCSRHDDRSRYLAFVITDPAMRQKFVDEMLPSYKDM